MKTHKVATQILAILNLDLGDWSFYHALIVALLDTHGYKFVDIDTDPLNAVKVTRQAVTDWIIDLEESLITK
jgi:hypothetical protein